MAKLTLDDVEKIDPTTMADLEFAFGEMKRMSNKHYKYSSFGDNITYMRKAAIICDEMGLTPQKYVQILWERLGDKKEFFSPKHLQGDNVRKVLENYLDTEAQNRVELNNFNIDYDTIWRQQHELAMRYISRGEAVEAVLLDSSLKFFAWFRIMATPEPNLAIIDKYKAIAVKELTNPRLQRYLDESHMPLHRIYRA